MLAAALLLHLGLALLAPVLAPRLGRRVFLVCALAPAATLVAAATRAGQVLDGRPVTESYAWAEGLHLGIDLRLDAVALLMVALVSGVGVLVFVYANGYFTKPREDLGRFAASLTGFAGAMLGMVLSDHVLLLFTFWELTSITSYLLIGTEDRRSSARSAALQAFLTTGIGGLAMLGGLVVLGEAAGTYSLSGILADPPTGTVVNVALVLVLLGAFTKSAQAPFHAWLPGAMAAPTPVSAYLHSATMVKAGIYLVARFAPAFAEAPTWRPLVLTVGLVTMLLGGWRALRQHDLKLVLAYGTISQLGFLMLLLGAGTPEATLAGAALLLAHGLFKAALFMTVGIVDHGAHTRDLRRLTGLRRALPITFGVGVVAAASMAGVPPLFGFVAKEAALEALVEGPGGVVLLGGVVIGTILTTAYTARYLWGAFLTKRPQELSVDAVDADHVSRPRRSLDLPAVVLGGLGVILGIVPALATPLVVGAAQGLHPGLGDSYLALWHGVNLPLALSMLALVGGALLWVRRRPVERLQAAMPHLGDAGGAYRATVNGALRTADRVTAIVQNGSLPVYLGVILLTLLILPGSVLAFSGASIEGLVFADRPMQVVVALVIITAAIAATASHRRFVAVLAIGAVGYGVAVLFILQGAPDLTLTQLLVETLVVVLFVLVLRHLPEVFTARRWGLGQGPRIALAVGVGAITTLFTMIAVTARTADPVSGEHLRRAIPEGGGANVVNVILVDFRALDTFGEIVVLAVAALGVTALVRAARRDRPRATPASASSAPSWDRQSLLLDTGVRAVLPTLLLLSLYLLFAGHNRPGGGFIGGLVAGAAFVLIGISRGQEALRRAVPVTPEAFLGGGVLMAAIAGAWGWLAGGQFLERVTTTVELPVVGELYLATTVPFDVGVYLVVVGLVLALLRSLGEEEVGAS